MPRIAIVQDAPVYFDREATLEKAARLVLRAAEEGAVLVVFPETFVSGYPTWIWRLRPGKDRRLAEELHARLVGGSVDLAAGELDPLREAVREAGVTVVVGMNERDGRYTGTTVFNTLVTIGPDGSVVNRHRKLVPTNPERMVWGRGDGSGLRVVDSPAGKVGALICWENYMPLARYTLYAQGVELYLAPTWDCGEGWIGTMRHIAREGRCWVAGCGTALRAADLPDDFPGKETLFPDPEEEINPGDSVVVAPGGALADGPLHGKAGLLVADIDPAQVVGARATLDVAGHYGRPDIFHLEVRRHSMDPVTLTPDFPLPAGSPRPKP